MAPAPVAPAPATPPPVADPQGEFDKHFIAFDDYIAVNVYSGAVVKTWSKPIEGKYRRPLSYGEFYDRVAAGTDLGDRYRSRRAAKAGLIVVGVLAMVGGGIAVIAQVAHNSDERSSCFDSNFGSGHSAFAACENVGSNDGYIAGGVLMPAGLISMIAGIAIKSQPVQPHEARELADRYNTKLRHDLGLDVQVPQQKAPPPTGITYTLAPSVDRHGAGLQVALRF
jgi:hypothetical protein